MGASIRLFSRTRKKSITLSPFVFDPIGVEGDKYLLIEFDEKWMWGLVVRRYAKACKELILTRKYYKAYHWSHINKVIVLAFTEFAFTDCIENSREELKLIIFRAPSFKVAEREVRKLARQEDELTKQTRPRKREDMYLVKCDVTDSSNGTKKDPKYSLQRIFQHNIIPAVRTLVRPGGK